MVGTGELEMSYKRIPVIYCIENTLNNKKYIGRSSYGNKRISEHIRSLKKGSHYNDYLQRSWNSDGESSFIFYIILECDSHEDLDYWEEYYINFYKTSEHLFGYNLDTGGSCNKRHSEETINKIREAHIGKTHSEETKNKISKNNHWKGKGGEDTPFYGKRHTEEVKNNLRKMLSRNGSPVFGTKHKNSNSQFYGVSIYRQTQKNGSVRTYWKAQLRIDKKQIVIGYFKEEKEAAISYNKYVIENNLLNPINAF